ncbi:FkbM family methyltransferase [Burkholderia sp. 8Y]|uniref:FkbM family methyltransferase n=1 Tax=Burkholderia sp. 8Y TaxID=2653133 RepID=UPI0012F420B3|nr:FkbM family methyltransferase [Burkholderia sp. 8Y]VXB53960.1 FkbM family methyltransferase [Burkholderia sp. 8Y]
MQLPHRPIAFVLAASNHGTMIVNRHDHHTRNNFSFGVGQQILSHSCFDADEVRFVLDVLSMRRRYFGDGVFAIDGGANIGVHSVEWARHMHGWGRVLSFEAQEVVYYALAGNLALNNCLNARARLAALGESSGEISIPQPDYFSAASFGSLELRERATPEAIGQTISYDPDKCVTVPMVSIDSLTLERVDLMKLDVEGMELDVLQGASETIKRCAPVMLVEVLKNDEQVIRTFLGELGYTAFYSIGPNVLALNESDPVIAHITQRDNRLSVE